MADAFSNTTTFDWIVPDQRLRLPLLEGFFEGTIRLGPAPLDSNLVATTTSPDARVIAGAAWVPPGKWKQPRWRNPLLMPRLIRATRGRALYTFARRGTAFDRSMAKAHPDEPHWYLAALGVSEAAQGTGAGSALVRAGLERSERDRVPAYLECVPELVGFYSRFGFSVLHPIPTEPGAPDHVGMYREP